MEMENSWRWRDWAQATGNLALWLHFGPGKGLHCHLILRADISLLHTGPPCQHYTQGCPTAWNCWKNHCKEPGVQNPPCPHLPWGTGLCVTCGIALCFGGAPPPRHGDESPWGHATPLLTRDGPERCFTTCKQGKYMPSLTAISELSYSHVNKAPIFLPREATMILIID